jgi:hypothetical protein
MTMKTNIEFTEMKKNKKESLKFTLKGDDKAGIGKQLYDLAGSIVHMQIDGCEVGTFPAEFVDIKKSAKGVVANFLLKGDLSDESSGMIYAFSGGTGVELTLEASQMSIEDFHEDEHEGLEYSIDKNGSVVVDKAQVTTDELGLTEGSDAAPDTVDPKVTNLRAARVTKKEKEEKARLEAEAVAAGENKPLPAADDDLPI